MKNILLTVSRMIAIGDREATIEIAIGDLFSNGDRDRDRDLKCDKDRDRDRDRNFRDRGHALRKIEKSTEFWYSTISNLATLWLSPSSGMERAFAHSHIIFTAETLYLLTKVYLLFSKVELTRVFQRI